MFNKIVFIFIKNCIVICIFAFLTSTFAIEKPDDSRVRQHFNFLTSYTLEGKVIYIFGCGHGSQNEYGMPGDEGDHSHSNAICFDINPETNANYVIDVTKQSVPPETHHKADIVYFEYLTPEVIYLPQTFINARLCLKEGGMIMWDCYSILPYWTEYSKEKYFDHCKMEMIVKTIDRLNDKEFDGLFNLSSAKKEVLTYYGMDRMFLSYSDNPFNGRKNSKIFHLQNLYIQTPNTPSFYRPVYNGPLPSLSGAVKSKNFKLATVLVKCGVHLNDIEGIPLLFHAADNGALGLEFGKALLDRKADPNVVNPKLLNYPLLHWVCETNNDEFVLLLLKHGANANLRYGDDIGLTPLIIVVEKRNERNVQALLDHFADPTQPMDDGLTPLKLAQNLNMEAIESLLRQYM